MICLVCDGEGVIGYGRRIGPCEWAHSKPCPSGCDHGEVPDSDGILLCRAKGKPDADYYRDPEWWNRAADAVAYCREQGHAVTGLAICRAYYGCEPSAEESEADSIYLNERCIWDGLWAAAVVADARRAVA